MTGSNCCCPNDSHGKLINEHKDLGRVILSHDMNIYIAGDGTNQNVIVVIYDIFGFNSGRNR
jgi:uncharacterized protein (DUF983 family)